jgi:ABC-type Na+ efflux pump permease subunit
MIFHKIGIFLSNPVLRREAALRLGGTGKNALRRRILWTVAITLVVWPMVAMLLGDPHPDVARRQHYMVVSLVMTALALLSPFQTVGAICGERERGTWDALRTTRISARDVVLGKWLGNLAPLAIFWAVLAPIRLVTAPAARIDVVVFVLEELLLLGVASAGGAFGLWASARRRNHREAVGTVLLGLFVSSFLSQIARVAVAGALSYASLAALEPFVVALSPVSLLEMLQPEPGATVSEKSIAATMLAIVGLALLSRGLIASVTRSARAIG